MPGTKPSSDILSQSVVQQVYKIISQKCQNPLKLKNHYILGHISKLRIDPDSSLKLNVNYFLNFNFEITISKVNHYSFLMFQR